MKRISKTEIKEMRSQSKKNSIMFAFTLPTVILYTIFFLVTMLIGVYYSFTDWNGISKDYTFVGLKNYVKVLTDERFREALWFNIGYTIALLLGALILVVSFSIYYTKKIIEPLEEFCKKISHTKGDQLQIINLEHMKLTREIANVIENYNEMANKMNEYLVREIIYDKNQRKIQSKMLRYQINPHFLYYCCWKCSWSVCENTEFRFRKNLCYTKKGKYSFGTTWMF